MSVVPIRNTVTSKSFVSMGKRYRVLLLLPLFAPYIGICTPFALHTLFYCATDTLKTAAVVVLACTEAWNGRMAVSEQGRRVFVADFL